MNYKSPHIIIKTLLYITSNYLIQLSFIGHGLVVRHFRENECGLLEELQPIDENKRYDFDYQQVTLLPKPVKVLPVSGAYYKHFRIWIMLSYTVRAVRSL